MKTRLKVEPARLSHVVKHVSIFLVLLTLSGCAVEPVNFSGTGVDQDKFADWFDEERQIPTTRWDRQRIERARYAMEQGDNERAISILDKMIQRQDPLAHFELAKFFQRGPVETADIRKAEFHYDMALRRPSWAHRHAALNLAKLYLRNPPEIFITAEPKGQSIYRLLTYVREKGNHDKGDSVEATYLLGTLLLQGDSTITADRDKAEVLFREAADHGHIEAMRTLVHGYGPGGDFDENKNLALRYAVGYRSLLEDKAEQRDVDAILKLAELYSKNAPFSNLPQRRVEWLRRISAEAEPPVLYRAGRALLDTSASEQALKYLEISAKAGFVDAMLRLGEVLLNHETIQADPVRAEIWLQKAFAEGAMEAGYILGKAYLDGLDEAGHGLEANEDEGLALLKSVSGLANHDADFLLGRFYLERAGTPTDAHDAERYLQKATQAGNIAATRLLGYEYLKGSVLQPNADAAIKLLVTAAEHDDTTAMIWLAGAYRKGTDIPKNLDQAEYWYRKAKDAGHGSAGKSWLLTQLERGRGGNRKALRAAAVSGLASAQRELGRVLLKDQDVEDGVSWLEKASEQGDIPSQMTLARVFVYGRDLPADVERGLYHLQRAVSAGNPAAMLMLGEMYLTGDEIGNDVDEARRWLSKASDLGEHKASARLGHALLRGEYGLPKELDTALQLLENAAQQGNVGAMATLGREYVRGGLLDLNIRRGANYLLQAASEDHQLARLALAEAYLKVNGLVTTDLTQAIFWLDNITDGDSQLALDTLYELLIESIAQRHPDDIPSVKISSPRS